ncbi:YncE family protein [Gordonia sp. SL306]|uniref:YncE family protein n=1 Tax=Gordonia sp. SL306 TaxID=2995145 RepID=UPI003B638D4A
MHVPRSPRPSHLFTAVRRPAPIAAGIVAIAAVVVVSGCGSSGDTSSTPNVPTVTPATAEQAPPGPAAAPAGAVVPTPAHSRGLAIDSSTVAVLDPAGTTVLRYATDRISDVPQRSTTPPLTRIVGGGDGSFLGVGSDVIARIAADGAVTTTPISAADPTAVARTASGQVLLGTADGRLLVFDRDLQPVRVIDKFIRVDDITVSPSGADLSDEQVVVLDRAQSSVTPVTISDGDLGPALRAGNGATNSTVDRYGRVLVANTRDDEIIGFFGSPLVMRFRYPVSAGPYAVDYDDTHNLMWVSTTANNEVVAYDLSGGEPVAKQRFPAVAQPDSIAVDNTSGTVYVLSDRGGLQVVPPAYRPPGVAGVGPSGR